MRIRRRRHLESAHAENLLSGLDTRSDAVSRLLAAAAGPARPHELAGEDDAVRAFRLAQLHSEVTRIVEREPGRRVWRPSMTVVAVGAAVLVVLGGVAVAAETGVLSSPPAVSVDSTQNGGGSSAAPNTPDPAPVPSASATASPLATSGESGSAGSTDPTALAAICRKLPEHGNKPLDRVLDAADYATLIAAAGSEAKVAAFCAQLLGLPEPPPSSAAPSESGS